MQIQMLHRYLSRKLAINMKHIMLYTRKCDKSEIFCVKTDCYGKASFLPV